MTSRHLPRRAALLGVLGIAATVTLAACSSSPVVSPTTTSATTTSATPKPAPPNASAPTGSTATVPAPAPAADTPVAAQFSHIHAVARDPKSGTLLLATHEGLFGLANGSLQQIGPNIDLMGFTVAPDGTYLASGHPGAGVDLPQPVGLITSTDSGATWEVASRGGESDFHALTAGPNTVIGFDGILRTTTDRRTWTTRAIPAPPRALAAAPTSGTLLAATAAGLLLSPDDGASWRKLTPPEPAVLVAWADEQTIVAVTTGGHLASSNDAGATWTLHPASIGAAGALHAGRTSGGAVEIVVAVGVSLLRTTDNGQNTQTLVR